jgi:ParB-like chromosome segregation protein Spo0J
MTELKVEQVPIVKLLQDPKNARTHSERNLSAIEQSLQQFGQRKPIVATVDNVVIAGNGTLTAATSLGWEKIGVVRVPSDWSEEQIRAFAIADNRTQDLSSFDVAILLEQLDELESADFDLGSLGFDGDYMTELGDLDSNKELERLAGRIDDESYTAKITGPHYEIIGERPGLDELYDDTRSKELQTEIENADLPEDLKQFLSTAAMRHVVFNYRKIAEYYPHAPKSIQKLMEESALVIVDFQDAIRLGFVKFSESIEDLIAEEENG